MYESYLTTPVTLFSQIVLLESSSAKWQQNYRANLFSRGFRFSPEHNLCLNKGTASRKDTIISQVEVQREFFYQLDNSDNVATTKTKCGLACLLPTR